MLNEARSIDWTWTHAQQKISKAIDFDKYKKKIERKNVRKKSNKIDNKENKKVKTLFSFKLKLDMLKKLLKI